VSKDDDRSSAMHPCYCVGGSERRCLWGGREAGGAPGLANLSVHLLNAVMLLLELSLNRMVRSMIYLLLLSCQLTAPH
jgi:hypothetical protein